MVSCGPVTIRAITPSMATEPRNEERVCKAAKRLIEERDGGPLVDTECPDKTEHRKQAVDLLFESPTKRYAIEHTRIESFPQQIADGKAWRWCADSARWASSGRHVDHRDRRRVMISM